MTFIYNLWREINERSEGLIIGAIGGYLVYLGLPLIGIEFTIIPTQMSIVESISGDFFVNRSLTVLVGFGIIVGYLLDKFKSRLPSSLARWL